jgi:hypothetical protein
VDLTGAYLFLTQIGGSDLSGVKGLTAEQVRLACGTKDTKLPAGMPPPDRWSCEDE